MTQAKEQVAEQYEKIRQELVKNVSRKMREKFGKKQLKKGKQGVNKDVRKKGTKELGKKYARKVTVTQQAVMQESCKEVRKNLFNNGSRNQTKMYARKKH